MPDGRSAAVQEARDGILIAVFTSLRYPPESRPAAVPESIYMAGEKNRVERAHRTRSG